MLDVVFAAGEPPSEHGDMLLTVEEDLYLAVSCQHHLADSARIGARQRMGSPPHIAAASKTVRQSWRKALIFAGKVATISD